MTQDTYRFAYDEAHAELREIVSQFEQLRLRKTQMEQVIEALRPLLSDAPAAIAAELHAPEMTSFEAPVSETTSLEEPVPDPTPFLVQQSVEVTPEAEEVPVPAMDAMKAETEQGDESVDPFQRRIDNALRQGFGGRESRVLSLGLNGLLTRA
jgi:hypothetical protein